MKLISNLNFPQKSIFGFKILSSLQSSISCYILLLTGKSLNLFFGYSKINLIAGSLFNIILNLSIIILLMMTLTENRKTRQVNEKTNAFSELVISQSGEYASVVALKSRLLHEIWHASSLTDGKDASPFTRSCASDRRMR